MQRCQRAREQGLDGRDDAARLLRPEKVRVEFAQRLERGQGDVLRGPVDHVQQQIDRLDVPSRAQHLGATLLPEERPIRPDHAQKRYLFVAQLGGEPAGGDHAVVGPRVAIGLGRARERLVEGLERGYFRDPRG